MGPFEEALHHDLHQYLLSVNKVDQHLPECGDIDDMWVAIVNAYIADGIREFNAYPTASLGWMMYIGMAIAKFWDEEWSLYSKIDNLYTYMRDKRGYDNLDEYILDDVLLLRGDDSASVQKLTGECASRVHNALLHQNIEPATREALKAYVDCLHQLYLMGAAIQFKVGSINCSSQIGSGCRADFSPNWMRQ